MSISDAQKSEVHEATADAESSPTAAGDAATTRIVVYREISAAPVSAGPVQDMHIIDDQTDDGGPLIIESADPELNPPHAPIVEFPTDGTPEIDPVVKLGRAQR
jgi:hypothetical protein